MSIFQILGVLALAGISGLLGLFGLHSLWGVEIDGQTICLALAMPIVPTCEAIRVKLDI